MTCPKRAARRRASGGRSRAVTAKSSCPRPRLRPGSRWPTGSSRPSPTCASSGSRSCWRPWRRPRARRPHGASRPGDCCGRARSRALVCCTRWPAPPSALRCGGAGWPARRRGRAACRMRPSSSSPPPCSSWRPPQSRRAPLSRARRRGLQGRPRPRCGSLLRLPCRPGRRALRQSRRPGRRALRQSRRLLSHSRRLPDGRLPPLQRSWM